MQNSKIVQLLQIESQEILNVFKKASIQGKGTPQEVADYRENGLHPYIAKYFPFPHRITKGIITDSYGVDSDSVDCLIISPIHPYTIDNGEKFSVVLADGVDVAIEIKPDLSVTKELHVALKQSISVKKLRRVKGSLLLKADKTAEQIEHFLQVPSFIFSTKAKVDINDTLVEIRDYYRANNIGKLEQFDYIIILGKGIIANYKFLDTTPLKDTVGGNPVTGFAFHEYGENSFAAFLFCLNNVPHASATFHGQIILHYLNQIPALNIIVMED